MRIGILGSLEVEQDGRRLEVAGARLQTLLMTLACGASSPVPAVTLADAIWDGDQPSDEQHALQSLVSRLRRALGDGAPIRQVPGGYQLSLHPNQVDAVRFASLAADGAARLGDGDPEGASRVLAEGLALWRGAALGDQVPRALLADAARLDDLRVSARVDRAEAELALGRGTALAGELTELAADHPLDERIAALRIRVLYGAGRQAEALAAYEAVRTRLADELGASPSPELQQAHLSVLRGEAQTAAVPAGPRTNLPARLTSFVGREAELERLGGLLSQQRLVTLVGAGGAGKTRLATEVAGRPGLQMRDGVWLVELAPVADPEAVASAVIDSLGLRELTLPSTGGRVGAGSVVGGIERLLEVLPEKRMLVVLDNCEHVLEAVAQLVDQVLGACPDLRFLCTSREPLGITGEMIVSVAPLTLPGPGLSVEAALEVPAVRLFADRAAATGLVLDADTVAGVIEVCRRVDGLPLAIELAAARLRSMTLAQLAERLDDRFRLLTGGSRTALPRQRTLRAVVDWSWDLLEEPERVLLARLSVFAGGATLEAAEAVCAGGVVPAAEVFDLICALVDRSLLEIADGASSRYRMLETIREYGLERAAEAGELTATRAAHATYFADLAVAAGTGLRTADQLTWLARIRADHDNVLAAMRHFADGGQAAPVGRMVVALLWFWLLCDNSEEAIAWVAFARAVSGAADPFDRVLLDAVQALFEALPGGDTESGNPWEVISSLLTEIEDADLSAHPLLAAVRPLLAFALGRDRMLELLEFSASHPDPWVRATVPFVRVQNAQNDGDVNALRLALADAVAAFAEIGDRWGLAGTLAEQSGLLIWDGDLDGAEAALMQSRALLAELGGSAAGGEMTLRLADIRARQGRPEEASRLLSDALETGDRFAPETSILTSVLALLTATLGDIERGRSLAAEALAELRRRPMPAALGHTQVIALTFSAQIEVQAGALDAARSLLREAHPAAVATTDMPIVAAVTIAVADLSWRSGDPGQSAELLGVAAGLRGSADLTAPDIVRLTTALTGELGEQCFAAAYGRGRELSRDAALARLSSALADGADQTRRR